MSEMQTPDQIKSNRFALEAAVICCLLQDWKKTRDLCDEFWISVFDFGFEENRMAFACAYFGNKPQNWNEYSERLPTADNARNYVEELHTAKENFFR